MRQIFNIIVLSVLLIFPCTFEGQEIRANVVINAKLIPSTVEQSIFVSLKNDLNNFLNRRKWTDVSFKDHEKVECNFFLNLTGVQADNVYNANLVVQAKRPVFGTDYFSPLINLTDQNFTFQYIKNQFVGFNEFRVQGRDPLVANLTAVFAYYVYLILGIDFETYSFKGGASYFNTAFFIVNNAPELSGYITGWEATNNRNNRFWIIENFISANYNVMHDVFYDYYRKGMDNLTTKPKEAIKNILRAIQLTYDVFKAYPGAVIPTLFIQPRTEEILNIFAKEDKKTKANLSSLLQVLDIPQKAKIIQVLN